MDEDPRKQGRNASGEASATLANGDEKASTEPLIFKGGTIKDDSVSPLEAALSRALDLAVERGDLEAIKAIVAELKARRR